MWGPGDLDEEQEHLPGDDPSRLGPRLAVDLFYCKDQPTPAQSTGLPPFSLARVEKPSSLKVVPEEKAQVKVLVERVVQLIRDGVTGMDLLEVFLGRRIKPLQACDHSMWMYSGLEDSTRIQPEDVNEDILEKWLMGITSNKDNPGGLGG